MLEILLAILKYSSLVLAAISSIWGLTHELYTKDENNKRHLTSAGKYAITFTLVSLLVSLNATGLESVIKQSKEQESATKAAQKDAERTLKLLQEISRAVYSIDDVEISFTLNIPLDDERLTKYRERLDKAANNYAKTLAKAGTGAKKLLKTKDIETGSLSWSDEGVIVSTVYIRKGSSLLPQIEPGYRLTDETLAYGLMLSENAGGLYISFSKSINQLAKLDYENVNPHSDAMWRATFVDGEPVMTYDLNSGEATIIYDIKMTKNNWITNKPINSIPDLLGANMFVYLNPAEFYLDKDSDAVLNELRKKVKLEFLTIQIGNHAFGFDQNNLVENKTADNYPYYINKWSETLDQLFLENNKHETLSEDN